MMWPVTSASPKRLTADGVPAAGDERIPGIGLLEMVQVKYVDVDRLPRPQGLVVRL